VTWLAYVALAAYAFYVYALGPVLAFLHKELHLTFTLTSLHSTIWSIGAAGAGLTFHALARRLGRHRLLWLAAVTTAVGAFLFVAGHSVWVTLPAALVLGSGASFVGAICSVALADRHGRQRDRALVEGNLGASGVGVLVPALLGLLAGTAGGWRSALLLPVLTLAVLFAVLGRVSLPAPSAAAAETGRLPRHFWPPAVLVGLSVGIEYCIFFYGVPLLSLRSGLSTADAAAALSLFVAGELASRVAGAWLTRTPERAVSLIGLALAIALAGFLVLWLAQGILETSALFVTGLGVGMLYPLTLALALGAGGGRTDQAMARTQVLVGVAVGTAPLLLGVLSDHVGLLPALAVEPGLIVVAALLVLRVRTAGGEQVGMGVG